ncbi:LysM peptidoglycan-binding domain-containing M23 family metallopeptidase [Rhodoblastus sp. 17X3]|uniref:LysM peptidoglycan-binding domain-containing M23 family metallopeptidase n=1 Tax=Rhodoblastus sp. 17X3 TaxID=3047026 RepID=UPI0024B73E3B|nr:LysM peptidoglycan-binding domain-containing M23 family metallopeptidase [Rhodoblastus sp. 17X3]MDI9849446.1 LysM peptidoglycan-binding domain-containing M23 family metallopeptidase [Rhodoblastus sp. 17X3]
MRDRVKSSGGAFRVALIGVATIMLGGCSETGQFGNTFGSPFSSSSLPRLDKTPTGSVTTAPAPQSSQFGDFFKEAFRPFDDNSAAQPARPPYAARPAAAQAPIVQRPVPPAPIASAPLAAPSAPSFSAPIAAAPVFAPSAARPAAIARSAPNSVGGWTSEGGTPVVVAQGESAENIAQRFGVPTDALLQLNGYSSRSQVQPGARLVIPVYRANGARTAAAPAVSRPAPQAVAAPVAPRLASKSLVGEEVDQVRRAAPTLAAPKLDAAALAADKRAKLAQAKAEKAAAAQAEAAKIAAADAAKKAAAKTASATAAADAAKKTAAKVAAVAPLAQVKGLPAAATAKTVAVATAAATQAKPAAAQSATTAAAVVAPVKAETTKVAKAESKVDAEATASLQPASTSAVAPSDSANPEFRWPARGRVIQGFGSSGNDGINIAVPEGTQVKAAENGVVAYAGSELKGYGNLVLIRHPNGFVTAYANNGAINVKRGDTVKRGQTIALSGQSGNVSSPQLHFELRKGSKPVDPSSYLAGL